MLGQRKNRNIAAILAFTGTVAPISGLHKFYLGQPLWGLVYLVLSWTPIPKVACAIEAVWLLSQAEADFERHYNLGLPAVKSSWVQPNQVGAVADALRQLDNLRADGLISEYEFEQKRRQLLDKIS